MLDKFAEELKATREQKGLTLHQVSLKTKIDYKFLEVMEQGDFSFLPDLYVKAFLKNYARVVGLDEEQTIKKFEAAKSGRLYTETDLGLIDAEQKTVKRVEPAKDKNKAANREPKMESSMGMQEKQKYLFGAVALIILIIAGIYYFTSSGNDIIVTEKPLDEIVQENQQRYQEEVKNPSLAESVSRYSSDSLNLNIASSETSWVKIVYDGKTTGEFILFPMSSKNVKALNAFEITFGNSKGIKLKLNGSDLKFDSQKRLVANIIVDSSGLRFMNTQNNTR